MINPEMYKKSGVYDFFMKSLGYQRSIDRFLAGTNFDLSDSPKVLDAGCGTGLLGLHFLQRYPGSNLVATDLESNFLTATLANADQRGIARDRISVGVANIGSPKKVACLEGTTQLLADESFDLICVGAVVGYAADPANSIQQLLELLAPGGTLLNLEMNESLSGRFVSHRYHYDNICISEMREAILATGCDVSIEKLSLGCLPAKFTRIAIIARKPTR